MHYLVSALTRRPVLLLTLALGACDSSRTATERADPNPPAASAVPAAVSFQKELSRGDYTFAVQTLGSGSQRQLNLRAERLGRELAATTATIEGSVSDVVVANLNNDEYPELLVFVTDAGSGSYGQLLGYEFLSRGRRNLVLPELEGELAAGYLGHDSFRVDGRTLIRSFPLYRPDDPNSTPSGGTRTIEYVMPRKEGLISVARHYDAPQGAEAVR
ncbi:hypothetical protein [Hymenobacter sp. B81]|uniref:hypothetical protein n=1 Tax=Hymenobacter sp. B81 TaxID=3344878 RepID=UPI0037DDD237